MKSTSPDAQFQWLKPAKGHQWMRSGRAYRLVPQSGGLRGFGTYSPGGMWMYAPPPGLFRKFARLNTSNEEMWRAGILAFADDYGDIIAQPQEGQITIEDPMPPPERRHADEKTWCRAIQHMRRAVDLWDGINDPKRHEGLQRLFVRSKAAITYRVVHHPLERKVDKAWLKDNPQFKDSPWLKDNDSYKVIATGKEVAAFPARDITKAARKALQLEIRDALTDTQTPSHSTPNLTPDLRLVMSPENLLSSMWLNFARVVSGELEERRCVVCREYFYAGPGFLRTDKLTCGAACRKRKSRGGAPADVTRA